MRRGGDRTSSALLRARGLRIRAAALPGVCSGVDTAEMRAPPWITDCPHQLLTEMPSCEAGYIDARPLTANSTKFSCNARPDHTFGSKADFALRPCHFRLSPESGHLLASGSALMSTALVAPLFDVPLMPR